MSAKMTWEEGRDKLKKFRDDHSRCSEAVIDIWVSILQQNKQSLSNDIWPIYEQVCVAACDCGRDDIAKECLSSLRKQFPKSTRVIILRGMYLESLKLYDKAMDLYKDVEEKEPNNTVVRKRRIAILKETNQVKDAIAQLNKYLKEYQGDVEAWTELCELYLRECDYPKAAFCMEELIVFNPNNHVYYIKYAEIKYTEGNQHNIETARKYFAQALRLNRTDMRALYGFFLCATNLAAGSSSNKSDNIRYAQWASDEISKLYAEVRNGKSKEDTTRVVEEMLQNMSLAL